MRLRKTSNVIDSPPCRCICRGLFRCETSLVHLATQKIPEQLEVVAEFPRNASGKILKFKLQEMFSP